MSRPPRAVWIGGIEINTFRQDVERAGAYHGHICSGQCIGVKMARLGLKILGLDPEKDRKRIYVFVECGRCPADAIAIVTGARLGRRTLRAMDYGKVAAAFVDLETNNAVRIQRKQHRYPADGEDMIAFYENLPDEEIFQIQKIAVDLPPCDLPGKPVEVQICAVCGEEVTDSRHVVRDGRVLCKPCADGAYYRILPSSSPD